MAPAFECNCLFVRDKFQREPKNGTPERYQRGSGERTGALATASQIIGAADMQPSLNNTEGAPKMI